MKKTFNAFLGSGVFLIAALVIMLMKPFTPELSGEGQLALGGLLITIGIWIFKPLNIPFSIGGVFLAFFMLALGLKPAVVFSGFTQSAVWTLIPALFFGCILQKTGLGRRIALTIIRFCKPTYPSMIFAWVLIGVALSLLTPSITVRIAIIVPIAVYCNELFGLKPGSRGNSLLLLTAFAMALVPGTGWLSGSLSGPILKGLFDSDPALEGLITFASWSRVALIPMGIVTVILAIAGYFVLRPDDRLAEGVITTLSTLETEPLSSKEKVSGIILVAVFAFFVTNRFHGIPDAAVCLAALFLFYAFRILDVKEFSTGINWDLIVFIGMALSLGQVFSVTGISGWIAGIVVPAIAPIASDPWVFVYTVTVILFLWRFIDIAFMIPTMAILTPLLPEIYATYGISPLVWVTIFVMAIGSVFMSYQNMWALMTESFAGDRAWTKKHLGAYGLTYFIVCLAALAAAIPIWIKMGLFR